MIEMTKWNKSNNRGRRQTQNNLTEDSDIRKNDLVVRTFVQTWNLLVADSIGGIIRSSNELFIKTIPQTS